MLETAGAVDGDATSKKMEREGELRHAWAWACSAVMQMQMQMPQGVSVARVGASCLVRNAGQGQCISSEFKSSRWLKLRSYQHDTHTKRELSLAAHSAYWTSFQGRKMFRNRRHTKSRASVPAWAW